MKRIEKQKDITKRKAKKREIKTNEHKTDKKPIFAAN